MKQFIAVIYSLHGKRYLAEQEKLKRFLRKLGNILNKNHDTGIFPGIDIHERNVQYFFRMAR